MADGAALPAPVALISVEVKFKTETCDVELPSSATVQDLKRHVAAALRVPIERQKLVGLPKVSDEVVLATLGAKLPAKLMLLGTRDEEMLRPLTEAERAELQLVENDLEVPEAELHDVSEREENLAKIEKRVRTYKPLVLSGFRPGMKTLVLDIDYTLFDHRSVVSHPMQQARPYLHEFLTAVYPFYNIVIWSATDMDWIQLKLREIGVLDNPRFRIAACLDHGAMITVDTVKYGVINTKPLGVLWGLFPDVCDPKTTIMFDDLNRNFLMNPKNGLRIRPCRDLPTTRHEDTELRDLSVYLLAIRDLPSFADLKHKRWERFVEQLSITSAEALDMIHSLGLGTSAPPKRAHVEDSGVGGGAGGSSGGSDSGAGVVGAPGSSAAPAGPSSALPPTSAAPAPAPDSSSSSDGDRGV